MTTLAALRQACAYLIGDPSNAVFPALQLDQWINDAIRDVSLHFPMITTYTINCSDDVREYDLEDNLISVISVEYPDGEDPKHYLQQRPYTHPRFWIDADYYDLLIPRTTDSNNPPQLLISTKPNSTEEIEILGNSEHTSLSDSSDVTTVLERHEHLIHLFVRWKAWSELAITEGADPDPIKLLSATQEVNAYRADRAYRSALKEAKDAESEARLHTWQPDLHNRIY